MYFLLLLFTIANAFNTERYQRKSIEFVDVASECYGNTFDVLKEFEMLNSIIVDQIIPKYENSTNATEIMDFIDFLNTYNSSLTNLSAKVKHDYLESQKIKEENKYVIKVLFELIRDIIRLITNMVSKKSLNLIQIQFSEHLNKFVENGTDNIMSLINVTMTKNFDSGYLKLHKIEFDNFMNGFDKWMIEELDIDQDEYNKYKKSVNLTDEAVELLILNKLQRSY